MSNNTTIKAAELPSSTLPVIAPYFLCHDYINGFCRRGEKCNKSHEICKISTDSSEHPEVMCPTNYLSHNPRILDRQCFTDDGPGELSVSGPRHDNDFVDIQYIRILPTMDEILCMRPPFMPQKDQSYFHHYPQGQQRLLDVHFRQLRYEHVEPIIDSCYHASQRLTHSKIEPKNADYDDRMVTPRGFHYSGFHDVAFEELVFTHNKAITARVSFACPRALRGRRMGSSRHLEKGMLMALIGYDQDLGLSSTFMEIYQRQSTDAMRPRTGNDLRASVILSFADGSDTDAVRRIVYNAQGLLQEKFVLVEIPKALYAGFYWTLKQLQNQSRSEDALAFLSTIAPPVPGMSPDVSPPRYALKEDFSFRLDTLRKNTPVSEAESLTLRPQDILSSDILHGAYIDTLCRETTLDRGQATALCENLCRGFAFTQGPPGTGKTYLGVSLAKVLLASRGLTSRKPLLVVCMTNHALDSYLEGLRNAGVAKLARLGRGSKEGWTQAYQLSIVSQKLKKTTFERSSLSSSRNQTECLTTEGISWCESLNAQTLSWPAVREHLKTNYPATLEYFAGLEKVEESTLSDIRLARKAGGFAYEFWCSGGDIKDIDRLLQKFSSMLGNDHDSGDESDGDLQARQRVMDQIFMNADAAVRQKTLPVGDVWNMDLGKRQCLLDKWREEIDPQSILDRTVEIHRRHQAALSNRGRVYQGIDARCLGEQDVIGMTTTACAMHWATLNQIGLPVVICEEAGEVMEAQSLCTLFPSVEHAIFIGDPLQLRPQVTQPTLSLETDIGASYRLDESLMERMMLPSSAEIKPIASSRLNIQRRMHPEIADIMRATLYPYLDDHESTLGRAPVPVMTDRVWWLDHQEPEDAQNLGSTMANSFSNAYEVEMVAGLVEHLVKSNEYNFRDITILTPYNGQLAALTARFSGMCSLWLSDKDREDLVDQGLLDPEEVLQGGKTDVQISSMLKLATIDNFQGEESRVVILSTVRSNSEGRVGFLKTPNRINVGCSRARNGFYIIGNASLMRKVEMWHQIVDVLTAKGKIGAAFSTCCPRHSDWTYSVYSPEQWRHIPECQDPCGHEFPCGHICSMTCHAPSLHERAGCSRPCSRIHEACGHPCTKRCGEDCGDCTFPLQTSKLPCGHETTRTCSENNQTSSTQCSALIDTVQLACGHLVERRCSTADQYLRCREKCKHLLQCGHTCGGSCHTCNYNKTHLACTSLCSKELLCGHNCVAPCHTGPCPPCRLPCKRKCSHGGCSQPCSAVCDPCVRPCDVSCPHLGPCTTMCFSPCDRVPCDEPCPKRLSCGHICSSLCGEPCATTCSQCISGWPLAKPQMFLPCGHSFDLKVLDNHVGISIFYTFSSAGRIQNARATSAQERSTVKTFCPTCGARFKQLRRYDLCDRLSALEDNLDRMYAKFGRKLNFFMKQMYFKKVELDRTFEAWSKTLMSSPLSGRTNESLVRHRGNALMEVQASITGFRDDVVQQFDHDITRLTEFLCIPVATEEVDITHPYRLRLDVLFYRARLIVLEESSRMMTPFRNMANVSPHSAIMIEGIKIMTAQEAKKHLEELRNVVAACEAGNLSRLETEARLVQVCFHIVLRDVGVRSDVKLEETFIRILDLCQTYPDTAGQLFNMFSAIRDVVCGTRRNANIYSPSARDTWWRRPKHIAGSLMHCCNGHPYSGLSESSCPECGRKVPKVPKVKLVDPNTLLKEDDFLAAMRSHRSITDKSWRG